MKSAFTFIFVVLIQSTTFGQVSAPFPNGANGLYSGHSFFGWEARKFSEIAEQNGYTDHQANFLSKGGAGGSPLGLWEDEDTREGITSHLSTGNVELFGLTYQSQSNSSVEDYQRWFDVAIEHNPDTHFIFGNPYLPLWEDFTSLEYDEETDRRTDEEFFPIVDELRTLYPNNPVHYVQYGKAASVMRLLFEAGELPDVLSLITGDGIGRDQALFRDRNPGHAGDMLVEVSALVWMKLLYGADIDSLSFTDYESDVSAIVDEVVAFNQKYVVPAGDFNADGVLDVADIDALTNEVISGTNVATFDLNGDGSVDGSDRMIWVKDLRNTWIGDSNFDGEFNTNDLVAIFQAGQYEDAVDGNSTWATGDWSGDGDFSTNDLVLAFQDGGFEQGPRESVTAVPEPGGAGNFVVALLGCLLLIKRD